MRTKLFTFAILFLSFGFFACGENGVRPGSAGDDDEPTSASESESEASAKITTTGYFKQSSFFDLYLTNRSDKAVEIGSASFPSGKNPDNAFSLYRFQVGNDTPIVTETFTGATLQSGQTITFTIRLFPAALKSHSSTFEVLTTDGKNSFSYAITANVVSGTSPWGGFDRPSDGGDSGNDGDGDGGDGGNGGNGDQTDTPAATLDGAKKLKLKTMYAYVGGNAVVGPSSVKLDIAFDPAGSLFTFDQIEESDGFSIPTTSNTFCQQPFVVTTDGAATGPFVPDSSIEVNDVSISLLATGVTCNIQSGIPTEDGEFGFSFLIDFTTGEVPIPSKFTADDVSKMRTAFGGYASDTALTGLFPTDAATRTIALVGCSEIDGELVIAGSLGKSVLADGNPICAIIEGQVIEP